MEEEEVEEELEEVVEEEGDQAEEAAMAPTPSRKVFVQPLVIMCSPMARRVLQTK